MAKINSKTLRDKAQKLLESYGYQEIFDSGSWKIYIRT